jgi:rubredoxin
MKCPHCGHSDRIHSGPESIGAKPGTCHELPGFSCACPGWLYWKPAEEWQLELQMEQDRVDRAFGRSMETLYEESD